MTTPATSDAFETLLSYIKRKRGFDFTGYKRPSLTRRFARRMETLKIATYEDYLEYLDAHEDEFGELFDTILINVTAFFRDPASWQYVGSEIVPAILAARDGGRPVRVWSTGCASGEEAYTLAIVLAEQVGERAFVDRVKIYATDVDEDALRTGRHGIYSAKALTDVPDELREKYFERFDNRYAFRRDLRRAVIFGRHNLLLDPPISHVDLLAARNTLMYFSPEKQAEILEDFHFALSPGGYLFLGKSEVLLTRSNLFVPHDLKRRVFVPVPGPRRVPPLFATARTEAADGRPRRKSHESGISEIGFESAPLAQLVVDDDGILQLANLQARRLFTLDAGDIGRPFSDLELSYRPAELRSRIHEARHDGRTVHVRDVQWRREPKDVRYLDIQVAPMIAAHGRPTGTVVSFSDVTRYRRLQDELERANRELETAYEELQATSEELETTNEELQSTNEELETTNEELQSTNEELETMNEELQSTNEEMETMNDEFRLRSEEVAQVNSFLESMLASFHEGPIAVDGELRIQAWNRASAELWGLRADEVQGEHLLGLGIGLPVDELRKPMRACLETGEAQALTAEATNRRGRPIECSITCTALRGPLGDVDGAIILTAASERQ